MAQPVAVEHPSPSSTTTLGTWEAENVNLGQVEGALTELRRHEPRAAVRTSVLTLVIVVDDHSRTDEILDVVRDLGARHPSRSVVLVLGESDPPGIDAAAAVHVTEREGHLICFDDVVLDVRGRARWHLDSLVEPLSLADLPVVAWSPFGLLALGNPLLGVSDRLLVDSRFLPEEGAVLKRIRGLAGRAPVIDLSWVRLAPWRSLLASLFDGDRLAFARGAQRVEVSGHFAPRHLLGGWLMRALRLDANAVQLVDSPHVSLTIESVAAGRSARFTIERDLDAQTLRAAAEVAGQPPRKQTLYMRDQRRAAVLADALSLTGRDAPYERALGGAIELLGAGS